MENWIPASAGITVAAGMTESKEKIDDFINAMIIIAGQTESEPEGFSNLPETTPVQGLMKRRRQEV